MYFKGDYFAKSDSDVAAKHLIALLRLDNIGLADKRKRYIARKREEIKLAPDALAFFSILIKDDICQVSYLRAIKEEFGIDLWEIIN